MVRLSGAVACGSEHFSESRAAAGSEQTWNPKLKRDFIAQKTCDGEPFLRSGTAKCAVPPVPSTSLRAGEMTNFVWFSGGTKCNFGKVGFPQANEFKGKGIHQFVQPILEGQLRNSGS